MRQNDQVKLGRTCQQCKTQSSLYKCPRCGFLSCSLECCRRHKERVRCSGKRDRTQYFPLCAMTDATTASDFHFLEDVLGSVQAGQRLWQHIGANPAPAAKKPRHDQTPDFPPIKHPSLLLGQSNATVFDVTLSNASLPFKWRHFRDRALAHGLKELHFMPTGMQRHDSNQSHVRRHDDEIFWTVEFCVHASDKDGNDNVSGPQRQLVLMSERSHPLYVSALAPFPVKEPLEILIRVLPSPSHAPKYISVTDRKSLRDILQGLVILEYPVLHIVPTQLLSKFSLLMAESKSGETGVQEV